MRISDWSSDVCSSDLSVVAERSDLPTALMHEDLQRQLEGVLACAARLGLPLPELHRLIDQAADPEAGRAATPTTRKGSTPRRHTFPGPVTRRATRNSPCRSLTWTTPEDSGRDVLG